MKLKHLIPATVAAISLYNPSDASANFLPQHI